MADLTLGTVEKLLGLLTTVIKDEVELQRGVQGDIQFIKDEMDSMNGFLLHLTKTETAHNDQHRAWMKQVRDIAYIAQDCIELYMCDLSPPEGGGCLASARRHNPKVLLRTWRKRRDLANQLHELKDRVREVGERRLRYGVSVPDTAVFRPESAGKDSEDDDSREDFVRALEQDAGASSPPSSFSKAISLLPVPGGLATEISKEISEILERCVRVDNKKMFLRTLYAYPYVTKEELARLKKKLVEAQSRAVVSKEVKLFSYSKLSTHYKSCLQYLTAFFQEDSISRTSLVRRWVAEDLVAWDEGSQSMEEAGERCFEELVFRGFVRPTPPVVPGVKVKSCSMEQSVKDFVKSMAQRENFLGGALPTHLRHQIRIREIAQQEEVRPRQPQQRPRPSWKNICPRKQQPVVDDDDQDFTAAEEKRHPMDEMAQLLKNLPEEYRLNVLDLGGCRTLKDHHLKSIVCKVMWLKYLSIRKTDVTRLPKAINNLRRLETLDVRQTKIQDGDTTCIVLPQLKHLLAGHVICDEAGDSSLFAVRMPTKPARNTEILRYVQILHGKADLEPIVQMKQLRKLGMVVEGSEDNMKHLRRAIINLSESLRSLLIWINAPPPTAAGDGRSVNLDDDATGGSNEGAATKLSSKNLQSLNMKYFRGSSGFSGSQLPRWIQGLDQLSKITLHDTQLPQNSLRTLGQLQSLRCLRLRHGSYTDATIILEGRLFQKLRFLLIDQVTFITRIDVQADAAPKLEKITWNFDKMEIKEEPISGIQYLNSLEELELNGDWVDRQDYVNKVLDTHQKGRRLLRLLPQKRDSA
jgi:hypothetical protein